MVARGWLALAAALLVTIPASARTKVTDFPAPGAASAWDDGTDPAPVVVLLHGDWGYGPKDLAAVFEPEAAKRGVTVVALACPKDEGCKGSFWQWNGSPAFLQRAVDALEHRRAVDRTRLWIAGWSGGATYLGWRTLEIEREFAAIAALGGGYPPKTTACAEARTGIFVLSGDKNPLHEHVKRLADYYRGCGDAVEWVGLPGADHDGEWRAIPARVGGLLDFFARQRRTPAPADAGPSALPAPSVAASTAEVAGDASAPAIPPATPVARSACGCSVVGAEADARFVVLAVGAAFAVRRRRALSRARPAR
jgi:MYXO-CTERM domain-containing protein